MEGPARAKSKNKLVRVNFQISTFNVPCHPVLSLFSSLPRMFESTTTCMDQRWQICITFHRPVCSCPFNDDLTT